MENWSSSWKNSVYQENQLSDTENDEVPGGSLAGVMQAGVCI